MTYIEFKNSRDHFTVDEYANAKTVEELEKLKEEIQEKHKKEIGITYKSIFDMYIGVIDKHISELKGENNGNS